MKQERFVNAMCDPTITSQTEAARKAGYKKDRARITAAENVTKGNVLSAIQQRREELKEYLGVDEDFVWAGVTQLAAEGKQETVKLNAFRTLSEFFGMKTQDAKNPKDAITAQEQLAQDYMLEFAKERQLNIGDLTEADKEYCRDRAERVMALVDEKDAQLQEFKGTQ